MDPKRVPKVVQKLSKNCFKFDPQKSPKMLMGPQNLLDPASFGVILEVIFRILAKRAQDGAHMAQEGAKMAQDRPPREG